MIVNGFYNSFVVKLNIYKKKKNNHYNNNENKYNVTFRTCLNISVKKSLLKDRYCRHALALRDMFYNTLF